MSGSPDTASRRPCARSAVSSPVTTPARSVCSPSAISCRLRWRSVSARHLNAYFYMAWTIGGMLFLLAVNMATSLTVEGAFDNEALAANCRAALRRTMLLLMPLAAAMALLAPVALGLFGRRYAAYGTPILELLAVATLPKALTEIYLGALRAQSRAKLIAVIQIVRCVLVLGLALALTETMGIVGAGLAVLVSESVIAVVIASGLRRCHVRRPANRFEPQRER